MTTVHDQFLGTLCFEHTVDYCYNDTVGIRETYQYSQPMDISSIHLTFQ